MNDPTEQERREAEALRRGLEGVESPADAAEASDALETAALLRWASDEAGRSPRRHAALRAELLAAPAAAAGGTQGPPDWLRWLFPVAAFAALVVAVAFSVVEAPAVPTGLLPAPDQVVLLRQAEAAHAGGGRLAALSAAMGPYRETVLTTLSRRYGEVQ